MRKRTIVLIILILTLLGLMVTSLIILSDSPEIVEKITKKTDDEPQSKESAVPSVMEEIKDEVEDLDSIDWNDLENSFDDSELSVLEF